jgi:hypothetical protein
MQYLGMVLFAGTTTLAAFLLTRLEMSEPWRFLIAAASVLPAALIALGMLREIKRRDELVQRVQFEAIAFAAVLVWLFTISWGALELMQVVPRLPAFAVATAIVLLYGFGGWWFGRRYG